MTIHNVSAYLQRFDVTEPPALEMDEEPRAEVSSAPEDVGLSLAEVDGIRRELEADFIRRLEIERETHEQSLRRAREEWTREESELLGRRVLEAMEGAFADLRADVARVITPFVSGAFAEKVLDELVQIVRHSLADMRDPAIRVAGPKDLIEKIGRTLDADAAVNLVESHGVDVSVDLSSSKVETRLADWAERVAAAKRGDA